MPIIEIKIDKESVNALESAIHTIIEMASCDQVALKGLDVLQHGLKLETHIKNCTLTAQNLDCDVYEGGEDEPSEDTPQPYEPPSSTGPPQAIS